MIEYEWTKEDAGTVPDDHVDEGYNLHIYYDDERLTDEPVFNKLRGKSMSNGAPCGMKEFLFTWVSDQIDAAELDASSAVQIICQIERNQFNEYVEDDDE